MLLHLFEASKCIKTQIATEGYFSKSEDFGLHSEVLTPYFEELVTCASEILTKPN